VERFRGLRVERFRGLRVERFRGLRVERFNPYFLIIYYPFHINPNCHTKPKLFQIKIIFSFIQHLLPHQFQSVFQKKLTRKIGFDFKNIRTLIITPS
jgi:hypothetical protein